MKRLGTLTFLLYAFNLNAQEYIITSDKTEEITFSIQNQGNGTKIWDETSQAKRITIINSGETVNFSVSSSESLADQDVEWQINSATGSLFKINKVTPPPVRLFKNSSSRKELFTVKFYVLDVLIDEIPVYVVNVLETPYIKTFDSPYNETDNLGRKRVAKFPEFSDDYIHPSCDGSYPEYVDSQSIFTTYWSNLSRNLNEQGSMAMTSPSVNQISACDSSAWELHSDSRVRRNDVNFHPHLEQDKDYYIGISILIPDTASFPSEFLDDYFNILFEFHQDHHLDNQLLTAGAAPMHLLLDKNNDEEIMRIWYGLEYKVDNNPVPVNRINAVEIPIVRDAWVDLVLHVRWKQMYNRLEDKGSWTWANNGSDGIFECWYRYGDNEYTKVKFNAPSLNQNYLAPFTYSNDSTSLYGPNIENFNPNYFTFNQYRLGNTLGAPFNTTVYFDEFRIGASFSEAIPQLVSSSSRIATSGNETMLSNEEADSKEILIYPNPNQGTFKIDLGSTPDRTQLILRDLTGKELSNRTYENARFITLTTNHPEGIYIVEVSTGKKSNTYKVSIKK